MMNEKPNNLQTANNLQSDPSKALALTQKIIQAFGDLVMQNVLLQARIEELEQQLKQSKKAQ